MFTRHDLTLIRETHKQRLAVARKVDSRTGDAIGAPYKLQSLGAFLAVHNAVTDQTDAERWFGLDATYYRHLTECTPVLAEGIRFAEAILSAIKTGADAMRVRCPSETPAPPVRRMAA